MKSSAYTEFKAVPISNRTDEYSKSIKMRHDLWALPTYEVGEIWEWYGNIGTHGQMEVVQVLSDTQILFKELEHTVQGFDGPFLVKSSFYIGDRGSDGYVNCGTPSLRKRIK